MQRSTKIVAALFFAALFAALVGCSSPIPRRNPVGERFPSIATTDLAGAPRRVPEEFAGQPVLVILGFVQDAQFDVDRWLLGLAQANRGLAVIEMPAARGLAPRILSGTIDDGMRRGIPEEDWRSVITVYRDAGRLVELTGNESPRNARVLLLDREGNVIWFHDRGYSAGKLLEIFERAGL